MLHILYASPGKQVEQLDTPAEAKAALAKPIVLAPKPEPVEYPPQRHPLLILQTSVAELIELDRSIARRPHSDLRPSIVQQMEHLSMRAGLAIEELVVRLAGGYHDPFDDGSW